MGKGQREISDEFKQVDLQRKAWAEEAVLTQKVPD